MAQNFAKFIVALELHLSFKRLNCPRKPRKNLVNHLKKWLLLDNARSLSVLDFCDVRGQPHLTKSPIYHSTQQYRHTALLSRKTNTLYEIQ